MYIRLEFLAEADQICVLAPAWRFGVGSMVGGGISILSILLIFLSASNTCPQ